MVLPIKFIFYVSISMRVYCQPNAAMGPPPPPGRGFQLKCTDQYAYQDQVDPNLLQQFANNAPPGYIVEYVEPCIYPGKQAHRYIVKYRSQGPRRCEEISVVQQAMNNYKPQNCNVGSIAVVPGGFIVTYMKFCGCYRRSYRRRRWSRETEPTYYRLPPQIGSGGSITRCDDRDFTCGKQHF